MPGTRRGKCGGKPPVERPKNRLERRGTSHLLSPAAKQLGAAAGGARGDIAHDRAPPACCHTWCGSSSNRGNRPPPDRLMIPSIPEPLGCLLDAIHVAHIERHKGHVRRI